MGSAIQVKKYQSYNVLQAARERVRIVFDDFERVYIAFSGGKDSSVMMHLVMDEAVKRGRKVGVLLLDLEAQYNDTIAHVLDMVALYRDHIDLHWICAQLLLRNAVSNFQPRWTCLGQAQPKSEAYGLFKELRKRKQAAMGDAGKRKRRTKTEEVDVDQTPDE